MDSSLSYMTALLQAVWPEISRTNWSDYCPQGVKAYDRTGLPKYTGLLMHRAGVGTAGANTVFVGFLPQPTETALVAAKKTAIVTGQMKGVQASIQRRDPANGIYGGGILCSLNVLGAYAIAGQLEIVDHLLSAEMMLSSILLSPEDYAKITAFEFEGVEAACAKVGMNSQIYKELRIRIGEIVSCAAHSIDLIV